MVESCPMRKQFAFAIPSQSQILRPHSAAADFTPYEMPLSNQDPRTAKPGSLLRHPHCLRQREQETAAFPRGALRPDPAAVLLHDAAAQCQPQPGSSQRSRIGRIALLEAVEDVLQFFRSD